MAWSRNILVCLGAGALLVAGGCVSTDATADIDEASRLASDRSGVPIDWTLAWDEPSLAWDGASPLDADAAVAVALQNNRRLRADVERIAAARADLAQAQLLPNPIVNLMFGVPIDGLGGGPITVSVMQQLAWIWERPARVDSGEAGLRARILSASDAALSTVAGGRAAHARAVFAARALDLRRRDLELRDGLLGVVRARVLLGEATLLDTNRAEFEYRQAVIGVIESEAELRSAKRALLAVLGRAGGEAGFTIVDGWSSDGDGSGDVPAWFEERDVMMAAVAQRLDVAAGFAAIGVLDASVRLARLSALPDVGAGSGYIENFSSRNAIGIGASITPKVFDDGSAKRARAASELRRGQIEADLTLQRGVTEVREAWVRLESARRSASEASAAAGLSAETSRMMLEAYEIGEVPLDELLAVQGDEVRARLSLNDARRAIALGWIELERAAGGRLDEVVIGALRAIEGDVR